MLGNAYYARCVERAAFDCGRRTVVWVGAAHADLCPTGGRGLLRLDPTMGSLLVGRYGSAVGQAVLRFGNQEDRIARLIEESARQCSKTRIAFAAADSPFARLRDEELVDYKVRPGRGFADLVSYYLVVTPEEELRECEWLEGFLSRRMLGRNRPYYELLAGGSIDDVNDPRVAAGARRL